MTINKNEQTSTNKFTNFTCISNNLFNIDLDPATFKLLLILISFRKAQSIYPSIEYLSKKVNVSSNTIRKGLKKLVNDGYVTISPTNHSTNVYNLSDKINEFLPPSKFEPPPSKFESPPLQNLKPINKSIKNKNIINNEERAHTREKTHQEREESKPRETISIAQEKRMIYKLIKSVTVNEKGEECTKCLDEFIVGHVAFELEELIPIVKFMKASKLKLQETEVWKKEYLHNKLFRAREQMKIKESLKEGFSVFSPRHV